MAAKTPKTSETTDPTEVAETSSAAHVVEQTTTVIAEDVQMETNSVVFMITLKEFIQLLSARDKRVEMIGGFYYTEKQAGHVKDYESEFQSRFVAFSQLVIEE